MPTFATPHREIVTWKVKIKQMVPARWWWQMPTWEESTGEHHHYNPVVNLDLCPVISKCVHITCTGNALPAIDFGSNVRWVFPTQDERDAAFEFLMIKVRV